MPLLTENSFQRLADDILTPAEEFTLTTLEKLRRIAEDLVQNPDRVISQQQIEREVLDEWETFFREAQNWTDQAMASAYLRGIQKTNGQIPEGMEANFGIAPEIELGAAAGIAGSGGDISATAREILDDYPRHHNIYTAFQDAAYNKFSQTRVPIVRDVNGKVRDLIIQASEESYKTADGFTRRQMSQNLMQKFADDNITGIQYADGRTMKLDTYSEMVARSQTGNAARQASINRLQQHGLDLVQISQHFPTSDLCRPWQARVYSTTGTSDQYPPLSEAISGGLYHPNSFAVGTEVLTIDGWKMVKDVTKEDLILSLNPYTHEEEWVGIDLLHSYNFEGKLIHFYDEMQMDLRVTPDHMVYVCDFENGYQLIEAQKAKEFEHSHITERDTGDSMMLHTVPEVREIEYDDMVYCVTLEKNHIMWVRRNGKTTWSGNCKHFQSAYIPGASELPDEEMTVTKNREQYELTQKQRYNERQVRKFKRRKASALTDDAREKAQNKITQYQARNRELVENNDFLRRKYQRESVTGTGRNIPN